MHASKDRIDECPSQFHGIQIHRTDLHEVVSIVLVFQIHIGDQKKVISMICKSDAGSPSELCWDIRCTEVIQRGTFWRYWEIRSIDVVQRSSCSECWEKTMRPVRMMRKVIFAILGRIHSRKRQSCVEKCSADSRNCALTGSVLWTGTITVWI